MALRVRASTTGAFGLWLDGADSLVGREGDGRLERLFEAEDAEDRAAEREEGPDEAGQGVRIGTQELRMPEQRGILLDGV